MQGIAEAHNCIMGKCMGQMTHLESQAFFVWLAYEL